MGKRIPSSRKHKKLKFVDPCYSGPPVRGKKKQLQWNETPLAEDTQEVSRHMEELIESKNRTKIKKFKRKKKKVIKDDYIIVRNEIVDKMEEQGEKRTRRLPSVLRQKSYESESQFLGRIQKMADAAIAEARVEDKYDVQLVNVDKEGNATYTAPPKEVSNKKREKRKKQKEKLQEKKRLKTDDKEFDLRKEKIQFGEVANAPPTLKAKPRKAPQLNKAGSRQLTLHTLLPSRATQGKVAPLSTKWKTLPPERRKAIESERLRAVQMYRMLKNKKNL